jgi:hypothetical protein
MGMKNQKKGTWEDCVRLAGVSHVIEHKNTVSKLYT